MGGGDEPSNIIVLTLRQHYIAHWMLWKAYGGKMAVAFDYMNGIKKYGYRLTSRTIKLLSQDVSKRRSERQVSAETRKKQRQAKLGRKLSPEHIEKVRQASTGRIVSEETKRKVSEAKKGKGNGRTGYKQTEATKQKIIQANFNRPIIKCPHCLKTMKDHGGAKRWHFNNCREQRKAA